MKFFTALITLGFAAQALAQMTTPTQEQWDAISSDLQNWAESILTDPKVASIGQVLATDVPESVLQSGQDLLATASFSSAIPLSYLTAAPVATSASWLTYLPNDARSDFLSMASSIGLTEQSILNKDLSNTVTPTATAGGAATSSPASGSGASGLQLGWLMGVCAGAVGVAAVLL
ncbi:hypothetical protein EV356DRAFT_506508 [Viridothelium virens]|uniref:Uncharacterized protein n=1 Tax=Viridothelium virens TaxID=1048519 RepID=A0A6A6H1D2_VIRVR|nr:hypothetical protein EV356DRAFT_506508 [Viridothelium virens]